VLQPFVETSATACARLHEFVRGQFPVCSPVLAHTDIMIVRPAWICMGIAGGDLVVLVQRSVELPEVPLFSQCKPSPV